MSKNVTGISFQGRLIMKKVIILLFMACLWGTALYAAIEPELIWAGGALRLSDESAPAYMTEAFVSLGQMDNAYIFTNPTAFVRESEIGLDMGVGTRIPVLAGQAIAGYNLFFDYTTDNYKMRLGTGAELFYPTFSAHLNVYLPISDPHQGEEALPGIDLTVGIPIPNAPFITVWPGAYYYNGRDRSDMKGFSFAVEARPMKALCVTLGGRNDAIESGRNDRGEIFFKMAVIIPMERLGEDLFKFDRGQYPVNVNSQLDHPVVREPFITYEHNCR
jgi:hypothetical protein